MPFVLVTGPAGHVGANLVRALIARGQGVRALVHRDRRALEGLDVEIVTGDVEDRDSLLRACTGVDLVYHTAAQISISMGGWKRLEAINVAGTRNVVEACRQTGVRRLVHFSTVEVLTTTPLSTPVDESRPLVHARQVPPYGRSKAAGEEYVRQAVASGLDAVILYPSAIIGPYDYQLGYPNAGLLALCGGRLPALVDGGFHWVDVRDIAVGALRAAERAPAGARYILSGHWASLRDLALLGQEICGVRASRLVLPMWLAQLGAPFVTAWSRLIGVRPLLTTAALKPLLGNRALSHERASRDLDYHPRPLKETVADTLDWFRVSGLVS